MFRQMIARVIMMLLIVVLVVPTSWAMAAESEPTHVLIVYDSLAKGTSKEGNVEALQRLLASDGVRVTLCSLETYQKGTLQQYEKVVGVFNTSDLKISSTDYLSDFAKYDGDYMHIGAMLPAKVQSSLGIRLQMSEGETIRLLMGQFIQESIQVQQLPRIIATTGHTYGNVTSTSMNHATPYGVRNDRYAYIPYFEKGNLSELALSYVLKDWFAIKGDRHQYIVFKDVYPFSDLKLLEHMADRLYDAGIPFMVSVNPVLSNTDYPAMKRYLETLKYVQSRNGSILVNAPFVASPFSHLNRDLGAQMETFIDVLADHGLAPLGIGAEMYWTYDQHYIAKGMKFFDSVVEYPNEKIMYKEQTNTSQPFESSLYSLQPDFLKQYLYKKSKVIDPLPMDTALVFKFFADEKELDRAVQQLADSWVTFADYKYEQHNVATQKNKISSDGGFLHINGQVVALNDAKKSVDSNYTYKQVEKKSFEKWFHVQDRIFIVIILFTIVAFGVLFISGYRLYKRKYFK
ncbi:DUF2334 domain-containing protein [Paenibacillus pini]|uniref:DUF2334 domain-containing protein n=1 Tax=Paenibacillus pini JCM 16418 TaxID=1236976 RepID=W7Z1W9_9BACL|nr:DUF2334 domain-containing protein [Paenibacillus pini]GAF08394.1 hypothetical protein JCM16418_2468 [Paenibacillus pini JCM 16418]